MDARRSVLRPAPSARRPGGLALGVPPGSLVVVAGLPGAGKTTLLRRLSRTQVPGVRALDAEEVAARLGRRAGRLPYRLLRPAVHGLHLLRLLRDVRGTADCVVTTDPMTSVVRRALLRAAARHCGRTVHVVLVEATAAQARDGQRARGRAVGHRRMARHAARSAVLVGVLERTGRTSFVDDVLVLPRADVARTDMLVVGAAGLSLRPLRQCAA